MPGIYVANRNNLSGRAGLGLPFTPTTGPIRLAVGYGNFLKVGQDVPVSTPANAMWGIYTEHAGECSVAVIAEWTGAGWGRVYFNHVGGSNWGNQQNLGAVATYIGQVTQQNCWSAVMANSAYNAQAMVDGMITSGFPAHKMSAYLSGTGTCTFGFAVHGGYFGEIAAGTEQKTAANYGYLGPVGQVQIWP